MREILFKAKRIDTDEWIEGYYCEGTCNSNYGISLIITELNVEIPYRNVLTSATDIESIKSFDIYEVKEDTLCQYTGLKDKNGNKIWENDIVKRKCFKGVYKIYWSKSEACWLGKNTINNMEYVLGCANSHYYEVIGNVFDNPELLEK